MPETALVLLVLVVAACSLAVLPPVRALAEFLLPDPHEGPDA